MDSLDLRLMTGICRSFRNHSVLQPLNTLHQHWTLQLMLQAVQQAEDNFASTQRIARGAIGLSQAFPQMPPQPAVPSKQMHFLAMPRLLSLGTPKVLTVHPRIKASKGTGLSLATVTVAPMPIWNIGMALQPSSTLIATTRVSKRMQHAIWTICAGTRRNVTFTMSSART
jgi:hypothetical protein